MICTKNVSRAMSDIALYATTFRDRGSYSMAVGGQIQMVQHAARRTIEQPQKSGMLTETCRSVLTESSRWISNNQVANTRSSKYAGS